MAKVAILYLVIDAAESGEISRVASVSHLYHVYSDSSRGETQIRREHDEQGGKEPFRENHRKMVGGRDDHWYNSINKRKLGDLFWLP